MKRFSSYLSAAIAALCLLISLLPSSSAMAATAAQSSTNSSGYSSAALSIEPRKNYVINPGQTITDTLQVGNLDSTSGLNVTFRVIDFSYTDLSGTPKLFLAQNAPQTAWSLKPYIKLPASLQLGPGGTSSIKYSITIPKNLGAGSYYSAILYKTGSGNGGNIGLGASGVSLVFVQVPGLVNENMALKKFGAYDSNDSGTTGGYVYIATHNYPQMIAYTLQNHGNVTEEPAGNIILKNMFGKTINSINKTNQLQNLALIGQERLFATCIQSKQNEIQSLGGTITNGADEGQTCVEPHMTPGLYKASLDLYYGQNGNTTHEITNTAYFWYLPLWFIVVLVVILIALAFLIWWGQRKIRALAKGSTFHAGKGIGRKKQ